MSTALDTGRCHAVQRSPDKLSSCYLECVPYRTGQADNGNAASPGHRRYIMRITLEEAPKVVQRATAWTISTADGPFFFRNADGSRCWGYFTKNVAADVARVLGGFADRTTTNTVKDVCYSLPDGWARAPRS